MKGKTKCPYCGKYVIVEVPDGATGLQTVACPNCGMKIKVNVSEEKREERKEIEEMPIHPTVQKLKPSGRLAIAGALLIIVTLLGVAMSGILLTHQGALYHGVGNYKGKIVDEDGNAIEGVNVSVGNISTITDEEGIFILKNISAGKHLLEAKKDGYKTIEAEIFVLPVGIPFKPKFVMEKGEGIEKTKDMASRVVKIIPIIATAILIISFLPLIGAIFCFMKKYFIVALISSIFGIFSIGFFIGSILSIIALIIILLSREEFGEEVKY